MKKEPVFASMAEKRRWERSQIQKELAQGNVMTQEQLRIKHGLQCPECFGVRITPKQTRFEASPNGWQCEECGCQWGARV